MDPRVRAGLISGVGAALPTVLLFGSCGPFLAIIGGLSAGLAVALDRRITSNIPRAGALAGLIAGILVGIGQVIGIWLLLATPEGRQALQQTVSTYEPNQTLGTSELVFATIILVLIDLGVMVGCGALGALIGQRMRAPATSNASAARWTSPSVTPPRVYSSPPPPQAVPEPLPGDYTPPQVYPPPPERYGLPSLPRDDAPPPELV